jgi:hypothetical protein
MRRKRTRRKRRRRQGTGGSSAVPDKGVADVPLLRVYVFPFVGEPKLSPVDLMPLETLQSAVTLGLSLYFHCWLELHEYTLLIYGG